MLGANCTTAHLSVELRGAHVGGVRVDKVVPPDVHGVAGIDRAVLYAHVVRAVVLHEHRLKGRCVVMLVNHITYHNISYSSINHYNI